MCSFFKHTANDGKIYNVQHYNLDMILSIGYRVKSKRGTLFGGDKMNQTRFIQSCKLSLLYPPCCFINLFISECILLIGSNGFSVSLNPFVYMVS